MVLGLVSLTRLPLEYLPEMQGRSLTITASYPASSPQEVERVIARPLEEELASLEGLESLGSTSRASGATVRLELVADTDMDAAALEVRERIDRARPFLPEDLGRVEVRRWRSTDRPVLRCRVAPREGTSPVALERFVDEVLTARLGRRPGVGNVEVQGLARWRVLVEADRQRLAQAGLTTSDLASTLRRRNRNVSAGQLSSGGRVLSVRVLGELGSAESVAALPVGLTGRLLGEVATVREEQEPLQQIQRLNGKSAITLRISKASGANSVEVCGGVKEELNAILASPLAQGFQVEVFSDDSERIIERLKNLLMSGLYGGILLCAVLFLFLRELRSTLIVISTIPLSVVLTFGILLLARQVGVSISLNVVSLMGLILGIGLVVDNGIVVLENIVRLREEGLEPKAAAAQGAREVSGAVTASMITSLIVFVPMLMADGMGSAWMRPLAVVVCAAVFSSLWVALTIVPLLAGVMLRTSERREQGGVTIGRYGRLLRGALRFRWLILLVVLPLCGGQIYWFFSTIERSWGGGESRREVDIRVNVPRSYSSQKRKELYSQLERLLLDEKTKRELDLDSLTTTFKASAEAESGQRRRHGGGGGADTLELVLAEEGPGERIPVAEVRKRLRKLLPQIPGVVFNLGASRRMGGGAGRSVTVQVSGRSIGELMEPAQLVTDSLRDIEGVEEVELGVELGGAGLEVRPRRELLARYGVSSNTIGGTVAASLSERAVTRLRASTRELDVILRLREEDRSSLMDLTRTPVPRAGGAMPVGALATVSKTPVPREIKREARRSVVSVVASVLEGQEVRTVTQRIEARLATLSLPRGVTTGLDQRVSRWRRGESENSGAAFMAFVLVLMVLAALFESYVDAAVIATTVPFALVGVAWAFWATNTHMDSIAWIGLMILVGIVVNHGIVLVDRVRRLKREEGVSDEEALIRAGQDRLRPIIMTAATTVLGLLPLVLQHLLPDIFTGDSGAEVYGPIGLAVTSGLIVSTALTLLVLPAVLSVSMSARAMVGGFASRGRSA